MKFSVKDWGLFRGTHLLVCNTDTKYSPPPPPGGGGGDSSDLGRSLAYLWYGNDWHIIDPPPPPPGLAIDALKP